MLRSFFRLLAQFGRRPRIAPSPRRRALPRVELLENRLVPTTIAGIVYNDLSLIGNYVPGDPLYAGNPITLLNQAGTPIASTVTDVNGNYAFTVNQTINTAPTTAEQDIAFSSPSDVTQSQQFNQFNPSLGTLTSVEIVQDAKITSDVKVDNLDAVASNVGVQIHGTVTLTAAGASPITATVTEADESATLKATDGTMGFTGTAAHDFRNTDATAPTQDIVLTGKRHRPVQFHRYGHGQAGETGRPERTPSGDRQSTFHLPPTFTSQTKIIYHYTPSNGLTPGQYTVVQTQNPPGTVNATNTSNGVPVPAGTPTDTIPVTLPPGGDSLANDFGQQTPAPAPIPPPSPTRRANSNAPSC